ncbi:hypothetical protein GF386_05500 [Candidatus Pacearchaeota archaeon]|nr:hypothetical protein [Candidatus Pacearchaeota archaeon]MBD3283555.1 hypothetical protein [Candidatus Pacearchaeota archaeon]
MLKRLYSTLRRFFSSQPTAQLPPITNGTGISSFSRAVDRGSVNESDFLEVDFLDGEGATEISYIGRTSLPLVGYDFLLCPERITNLEKPYETHKVGPGFTEEIGDWRLLVPYSDRDAWEDKRTEWNQRLQTRLEDRTE